ncbi:MAG TPA: SPOR domain-containing protein [Gammaproteobacteria bacterium]|nr:SPOR domain-containing protein [Gammaproteobacteria bacterium]
MAKDYKNSPKPKDKPKSKSSGGLPGWVWGFMVGILGAILIIKLGPVLYQAEMHAGKKGAATAAAAATHTAAPPASTATHYDFYKMLPSFQVVIPGQDKEVKSGNPTTPVEQPGTYILQVGSFPSFADADKMKATLALQGIESSIQQVQVNNGSTWNRVRIGPIKDLKELNSVRAKLAEDHIEPLVIKQ